MTDMNLSNLTVREILACNRIRLPAGTARRRSSRERFALAFKVGGRTEYVQNGTKYLSDPLHVCLLPQGSDYSFTCLEEGECLEIEFEAEPSPLRQIRSIPLSSPEPAQRLYRVCEHALAFRTSGSRAAAMAALYRILALLAEENAPVYVSADQKKLLEPAFAYIEAHLSEGTISNETLAAECGVSCVYFRKLFTRLCRKPPSRYIADLRIRRACGLLIGDRLPVGEIAEACGFSGIYPFSRAFRAATEMTPTEYRRMHLCSSDRQRKR